MKGLILDTSSDSPFCILTENDKVMAISYHREGKTSVTFIHSIKEILENNQTSFNELGFIAIGKGPGSFSGTRVGVIIASSLSYGLKIPLIEFSSLSAYSIEHDGLFFCLADAKSKGFYTLKGEKNGDSLLWQTLSIQKAEDLACCLTPLYCLNKQALSNKFLTTPSLFETTIDFARLSKECFEKALVEKNKERSIPSIDIDYLRIS